MGFNTSTHLRNHHHTSDGKPPTTSESLLLSCCFLSFQDLPALQASVLSRLALPSLEDTWIRVQGEQIWKAFSLSYYVILETLKKEDCV